MESFRQFREGIKHKGGPVDTVAPIPVMRPKLPPVEALLPYLREIDESRWYSNFGPLLRRFQSRLAEHFGSVRKPQDAR